MAGRSRSKSVRQWVVTMAPERAVNAGARLTLHLNSSVPYSVDGITLSLTSASPGRSSLLNTCGGVSSVIVHPAAWQSVFGGRHSGCWHFLDGMSSGAMNKCADSCVGMPHVSLQTKKDVGWLPPELLLLPKCQASSLSIFR